MVGVGVVADPPLAGAARAVVLDAVAGEHLDAAVVHPYGDFDLHLAERRHENAAHVAFEADEIGGAVELARDDGLPRHRAAGSGGGGDARPPRARAWWGGPPGGRAQAPALP